MRLWLSMDYDFQEDETMMGTKQAVMDKAAGKTAGKTAGNVAGKNGFRTRDIVLVGMFAAVLAVISQISLPMPSGVPVTIQLFGVALVGAVLGSKLGFMATVVYILIGAVGLPVFANFHGGFSVLAGMTGGYIMGWPVMALLCGIRPGWKNRFLNLAVMIVLALAGMMVVEFAGGLQWSRLSGDMSLGAIMVYSFVAFIPKDAVLTVLAVVLGSQMRRSLVKAGYLG